MRVHRLSMCMPAISVLAGATVLVLMFGPSRLLNAFEGANLTYVGIAIVLGVVMQLIRAKRSAIMLSQDRPVSLGQSFSTMVVGNGVGDLIPVAPTCIALRCLLTRRLLGIPMAFSTGVFLADGLLDSAGILPLMAYLVLLADLPTWLRMLLLGLLVQVTLMLLAPVLVAPVRQFVARRTRLRRLFPSRFQGLWNAGDDMTAGLCTVVGGGLRTAVPIVGLSIFMGGVWLLRLQLLLSAFGLQVTINQLFLLLCLTWLVSSSPINIPGSGTWAAAKLLTVIQLVGMGAGGYVMLSRVIASAESPILGLGVALWWSIRGNAAGVGLRELLHAGRYPVPEPEPIPVVSRAA